MESMSVVFNIVCFYMEFDCNQFMCVKMCTVILKLTVIRRFICPTTSQHCFTKQWKFLCNFYENLYSANLLKFISFADRKRALVF